MKLIESVEEGFAKRLFNLHHPALQKGRNSWTVKPWSYDACITFSVTLIMRLGWKTGLQAENVVGRKSARERLGGR
jgi:hypothetical protein